MAEYVNPHTGKRHTYDGPNYAFPLLRFTVEEWRDLPEQTRQELTRGRVPFVIVLRRTA